MQTDKLSILPNPNDNIYPWSNENIDAIIDHFFIKNGIINKGDLSFLYDGSVGLSTNQLECVARLVSENFPYFKKVLQFNGLTISNLMHYGIDAICGATHNPKASKNRNAITASFFQLINNA